MSNSYVRLESEGFEQAASMLSRSMDAFQESVLMFKSSVDKYQELLGMAAENNLRAQNGITLQKSNGELINGAYENCCD